MYISETPAETNNFLFIDHRRQRTDLQQLTTWTCWNLYLTNHQRVGIVTVVMQ